MSTNQKYLCKKAIINMTSWIRNQIANLYDFVSAPIVQTSPFLLKGVGKWGVNFDYLPWREGGWCFSYWIFSRFIIFTFSNYFTKPSSAVGHSQHQLTSAADIRFILQLMMTLLNYFTLCKIGVMCLKKNYFLLPSFYEKVILSCLKINLKTSHKLR